LRTMSNMFGIDQRIGRGHAGRGYEVEFATLEGETLAIVSLSKDEVRPIAAREIASARVVASP